MKPVSRRQAIGIGGASVAAALGVGGAAQARGQKPKTNSEPVAASKPGTEMQGPRELFAVVDAQGGMIRGQHVAGVKRLDTGVYEVTFVRDVRQGAYLATAGGTGYAGIPLAAAASVMGRATDPRGVVVFTVNMESDPIDSGFHLLVICPDGPK